MVGDITNTGVMRGEKDLVLLTTGGNVRNEGEASTSGQLSVQGKSVFNKGILEGGQADVVAKEGSIVSDGGKLSGRDYLRAVAAGSIILKETEASSAKGDISFEASDQIHFYAPHVDAFGNITIFGEKGVTVHDISDDQRVETHTEQKADSLFGASKKVDFVHDSRKSRGAYFASQNGSVTLRSAQGDVSVTNIHVKASQTILEALNGVVSILQGENESFSQEHERREDLALVKDTIRTKHEITHSASSFSGGVTVRAKETIVETVKDQALEFMKEIEKNGGVVSYKIIENILDIKEESHTAPTAALSAVIALAASICTAGVGGAIVGAASSAMTAAASAVISGAAASLLTQASLALICCEGDLGKAAQRLASEESLKSMIYSTVTAGVTAGISNALHIPQSASQMKTTLDHIERQAVQMSVNTTASIVTGQKPEDAFVKGLKGAAAGVIGGVASSQIGTAYGHHDINFIGHKFLHALVGGTTGAILSENPLEGAAAGAFGAVTAEMIGELVLTNSHKIAGGVVDRLEDEKIPLTRENI